MQRDPRQSQVNPARTTFGDNLIWYGFYHPYDNALSDEPFHFCAYSICQRDFCQIGRFDFYTHLVITKILISCLQYGCINTPEAQNFLKMVNAASTHS